MVELARKRPYRQYCVQVAVYQLPEHYYFDAILSMIIPHLVHGYYLKLEGTTFSTLRQSMVCVGDCECLYSLSIIIGYSTFCT